jgi:hypothetical protein
VENPSGGNESSLSLQRISIDHPYEEDDEEIYLNQNALENYLLGNGPQGLPDQPYISTKYTRLWDDKRAAVSAESG